MKLCEPCKLAKPIHHVHKRVHPERKVLHIFDEIHVNVFMIKPIGYNKHVYRIIFMDGAVKVRWAYTLKDKGNPFDCIKKLI